MVAERGGRVYSGNEGMRAALLIRLYLPLHSCLHRETPALQAAAVTAVLFCPLYQTPDKIPRIIPPAISEGNTGDVYRVPQMTDNHSPFSGKLSETVRKFREKILVKLHTFARVISDRRAPLRFVPSPSFRRWLPYPPPTRKISPRLWILYSRAIFGGHE